MPPRSPLRIRLRGMLKWQGQRVDSGAIRGMPLLRVEGERDDICAMGQTMAAQDLCSGIRPYLKQHHMQPGAGHYGIFSRRRWEQEIYPIVRDMIYQTEARGSTSSSRSRGPGLQWQARRFRACARNDTRQCNL